MDGLQPNIVEFKPTIGLIAAVSKNGVFGLNNKLPFNYPEDLKHFRATTANSTVIMGRHTFFSIGKPLPGRRNLVISSKPLQIDGVQMFSSVSAALDVCDRSKNIWFIGGYGIYEEGMKYADQIILTITPDWISDKAAVKFPWINPLIFQQEETYKMLNDNLAIMVYNRIMTECCKEASITND